MDTPDYKESLLPLRQFFQSGVTRPYEWRRRQLIILRAAIVQYGGEIAAALYADLRKSPEEAYGTETGLLLAEISTVLRHLRSWMRPERVRTNLVNLPSRSTMYRDPLGTVLIIAPWNYPFQLALLPLVGAIAGGNNAIIKPSELAPATAALIEKILRAIFPPDFVRVVQGDGAELVPALMRAFRFDHVFFTGSIPVGRSIYQLAAEQLVPVTLELGGKSPVVVAADADLPATARRIVFGKFTNAGQTCIAPDYVLVDASIRERLLSAMQETIRSFYGEKAEESPDYGRIINEKRYDKLVSYLSQARIVAGGRTDRQQKFIEPTILTGVSPEDPLMKEEIFGPILPVIEFHSREEALAIIQRNPNPLAFYLFTKDKANEKYWMDRVSFGGGCINNTEWHFANHHLPFGGIGLSGIGAYHGRHSFETFTHAKPVMRTPTFIDPSIKYPPFKGKMKWFKMFLK